MRSAEEDEIDDSDLVFGSFYPGEVAQIIQEHEERERRRKEDAQNAETAIKPTHSSWAAAVRSKSTATAQDNHTPAIAEQKGFRTANTTAHKITQSGEVVRPEDIFDFWSRYPIQATNIQLLYRGLSNTGNACFRNVIFQSFVAIPPFMSCIIEFSRRFSFSSLASLFPSWAQFGGFLKEFDEPSLGSSSSQTQKTQASAGRTVSLVPDQYLGSLITNFQRDNPGQQEDAQEFLTYLLDVLHEEMLAALQPTGMFPAQLTGTTTPDSVHDSVADESWVEVGKAGVKAVVDVATRLRHTADDSIISRFFHGTFRSDVRKGGQRSVTPQFQRFHCLSLDIESAAITSVEQALASFFREEAVQKTIRTRMAIDRLPPVLILHLKRFTFNSVKNSAEKIAKSITYSRELRIPENILSAELRAKVQHSDVGGKLTNYRLVSVVVHHGKRTNGGHYTCYVRDPFGMWRCFDDALMEQVTERDVLAATTDAYLLYYCKCELLDV